MPICFFLVAIFEIFWDRFHEIADRCSVLRLEVTLRGLVPQMDLVVGGRSSYFKFSPCISLLLLKPHLSLQPCLPFLSLSVLLSGWASFAFCPVFSPEFRSAVGNGWWIFGNSKNHSDHPAGEDCQLQIYELLAILSSGGQRQ